MEIQKFFDRLVFLLNLDQKIVSAGRSSPKRSGGDRACFFCLDPNHLISDCKVWKQKHAAAKHKSVALMQTLPKLNPVNLTMYQPFLFTGTVSLSSESEERQIRILRDTGASHSFILREMLPFSTESYMDTDCGSSWVWNGLC